MNASTRVYEKMNQQLYKKVGRKYVPVNDVCAYDGLQEGWWLVKVAPSSTSIRQCVYPHKAEIQAAAQDKADELIDIIRAASIARPPEGVPLSEAAFASWKKLVAKHGDEFSTMHYPSIQENAEKIIEALLK
jgi:hypothetical protein